EDHSGGSDNSLQPKFSSALRGRNKGMPVGWIDVGNADRQKDENDDELDGNDQIVEAGGFLDADNQQGADEQDDKHRRQVKYGGGVAQGGRVDSSTFDLAQKIGLNPRPTAPHLHR